MGELRWGMPEARVHKLLRKQRRVVAKQDASALLGELLPRRVDSVLVGRDALSRAVYLFRAGKLRWIYVLLEALAFPEGNFRAFAANLAQRFGVGAARAGALSADTGVFRHWVEWHDARTRLRAVDETNHRGFYCLVFEERATN